MIVSAHAVMSAGRAPRVKPMMASVAATMMLVIWASAGIHVVADTVVVVRRRTRGGRPARLGVLFG